MCQGKLDCAALVTLLDPAQDAAGSLVLFMPDRTQSLDYRPTSFATMPTCPSPFGPERSD